jgi:hypothetical protein
MKVDYVQRFEVLTAVKMSMLVFWVVTPCGLVDSRKFFPELLTVVESHKMFSVAWLSRDIRVRRQSQPRCVMCSVLAWRLIAYYYKP